MAIPQGLNQRLSLDLVSGRLLDSRRFRVLFFNADFSRECLAGIVDTLLSAQRVEREFDTIARMRGYPCMVVAENATELTSNAILRWQEERDVEWRYITLGKLMQNCFVESFNGRLCDEPLKHHQFANLTMSET